MTKLKPGDRIDCRIKLYEIVSPYKSDYDDVFTFEIISQDRHGYYVFVPCYLFLKDTTKVDKFVCKQLQINEKFIGEKIIYVQENMIYQISTLLDGSFCSICNTFCQYAQPNQQNATFICWSCISNPYRKSF